MFPFASAVGAVGAVGRGKVTSPMVSMHFAVEVNNANNYNDITSVIGAAANEKISRGWGFGL